MTRLLIGEGTLRDFLVANYDVARGQRDCRPLDTVVPIAGPMKFPIDLLQQCWFLAGPTASGKSALGLQLAEQIGGEIVSLDSMAIYRGMDIGTAKPTPDEQQQVPHHLLDVIDPDAEFSTARYVELARQACEQIVLRNRRPLFVGGTGLYLRAILRGVFEGPPADWEFRQNLMEQAAGQPPDWLLRQLTQIDPTTAARLHGNDTRRLVRALEIHQATGLPPSQLRQEGPLPAGERPRNVFWLHPPRDWLAARIDRRVDMMFTQGLEAETRGLLAGRHPPGRTARQALGYREMIDWLEGRLPSREATRALIQTRTRQFAKRQHTWFRNLEECREVVVTGQETTSELCHQLIRLGNPVME